MKLSTVIQAIKDNKVAPEKYWSCEKFLDAFGFSEYPDDLVIQRLEEDIKVLCVESWLCTDTTVGTYLYFFKGNEKPFLLSDQTARKNPIRWFIIDKDQTKVVWAYLVELCSTFNEDYFSNLNLDDEIEFLDMSDPWLSNMGIPFYTRLGEKFNNRQMTFEEWRKFEQELKSVDIR